MREFWQTFRGIQWYIKIVPRNQSGIDVYIARHSAVKDDPMSYPHIHAYYPDRKGSAQFATVTWQPGRGREHHSNLGDLRWPDTGEPIPGLEQYVLDLLANLGEGDISKVTEEGRNSLRDIDQLKYHIERASQYSSQDWTDAVNLSKQLNALSKEHRISRSEYETNRRELDTIFERLKGLRAKADAQNKQLYEALKEAASKAITEANNSQDMRRIKDELIRLQKEVRSASLMRDNREELLKILQGGFEVVQRKQKQRIEEQRANYINLKQEVYKAVDQAKTATDTRLANDELKRAQGKLKATSLGKQERDELWNLLQQGFDAIKSKRDARLDEQVRNEQWLQKRVWDCELEAKTTADFRTTREKFKAVSQELRQKDLKREDREKLITRLNEAFRVLSERQDRERQNQQEAYKSKLRQTIQRKREGRDNLENSIRHDEQNLSRLYDQYRNVRSGPRELEIKRSIDSKITSVNQKINSKREKIRSINDEINELERKLWS